MTDIHNYHWLLRPLVSNLNLLSETGHEFFVFNFCVQFVQTSIWRTIPREISSLTLPARSSLKMPRWSWGKWPENRVMEIWLTGWAESWHCKVDQSSGSESPRSTWAKLLLLEPEISAKLLPLEPKISAKTSTFRTWHQSSLCLKHHHKLLSAASRIRDKLLSLAPRISANSVSSAPMERTQTLQCRVSQHFNTHGPLQHFLEARRPQLIYHYYLALPLVSWHKGVEEKITHNVTKTFTRCT